MKVPTSCRVSRIRFSLWAALVVLQALRPAVAEDLFFTASAYAPGAGGSEFVHEVEVHNPTGAPVTFELAWLPQAEDNSNPLTVDVTVDAARSTRFDNILVDVLELDPGAIGALRVRTASDELLFHSTIINRNSGATSGQIIPAARALTGFSQGETALIFGLAENADVRSNMWCLNTTELAMSVNAQLMTTDGIELDEISFPLAPLSNLQISRIFQSFAPVDGFVRLSTPTLGGSAICDGVVVDNYTHDPATELGANEALAGTEFYVPYVVESATGSSTVDLYAPDGDALVTIALLPTGGDNSNPTSFDFAVAGGTVLRLGHVLANVFTYQGTGALRLSASGGDLMASSRTLENPIPDSVSWWVPAVPAGDAFGPTDEVVLIHLEESADFRTDIGFVNTSATAIDLEVELFGGAGEVLGTTPVELPPFGHGQIDGAFAAVGHPSVPVGFAEVTASTSGGSFIAYATITDLDTRDAYSVTGQPMPSGLFSDGFESGGTAAWSGAVP